MFNVLKSIVSPAFIFFLNPPKLRKALIHSMANSVDVVMNSWLVPSFNSSLTVSRCPASAPVLINRAARVKSLTSIRYGTASLLLSGRNNNRFKCNCKKRGRRASPKKSLRRTTPSLTNNPSSSSCSSSPPSFAPLSFPFCSPLPTSTTIKSPAGMGVCTLLDRMGCQYVKPSTEVGQSNHTRFLVCSSKRYCLLPVLVLSWYVLIDRTSFIKI